MLRKPQSGALRGTPGSDGNGRGLYDDRDPRISTPTLTRRKWRISDPADLAAMSMEVVYFLLPKSAFAEFADSLTVDDGGGYRHDLSLAAVRH